MVRLDNNRDKLSSSALFFLSRSLSCSRTFFERIKRKKKGKKKDYRIFVEELRF